MPNPKQDESDYKVDRSVPCGGANCYWDTLSSPNVYVQHEEPCSYSKQGESVETPEFTPLQELRRGLSALYLEVPASIADDLNAKFGSFLKGRNPMTETEEKPEFTPGAMRAAKLIDEAVLRFATNEIELRPREWLAEIISSRTGYSEMYEALQVAMAFIDSGGTTGRSVEDCLKLGRVALQKAGPAAERGKK